MDVALGTHSIVNDIQNRDPNTIARAKRQAQQLSEKLLNIQAHRRTLEVRLRQLGVTDLTKLKVAPEKEIQELIEALRRGATDVLAFVNQAEKLRTTDEEGRPAIGPAGIAQKTTSVQNLMAKAEAAIRDADEKWRLKAGITSSGFFSESPWDSPVRIDILNQQRVDRFGQDGKVEGYAMEDAIEEPRSILFTIKPEELFFGYTKYQYRISAENAQLEAVTLSKEKEAEIAVLILNYESELARVELLAEREGVEVSKLLSRYQDLDLSSGATRTDKEKVRDIEYNTVVHYFEARLALNEALTKLTDAAGLRIDAVSLANSEVVKDEIEDRGSNVMGKLRKFEQSQMANWSEYVKTHPESVIHAGELDKAVLAAKAARWQFKQLWAQVGMRDGEVTAKAGLRARLLGDAASHRRKREAVEQEAITAIWSGSSPFRA